MTITQILLSATPDEALAKLIAIRKSHWIESYQEDSGAFLPTQDYLDAGIEILKAYRQVLAFELGFGPGENPERRESYMVWAEDAKSPASLAHRLANLLMSRLDGAFHEQLSSQYEFVPSHITQGDTEWHWWMAAMREAGLHEAQFVDRDGQGAKVGRYLDPEDRALPVAQFPTEEAALVGHAFMNLCRAARDTTKAAQGFADAASKLDKVGLVVDEVQSHASEHDYNVDSLDMALTGIDEAMTSLDIQLTQDEIQMAADRLLAGPN